MVGSAAGSSFLQRNRTQLSMGDFDDGHVVFGDVAGLPIPDIFGAAASMPEDCLMWCWCQPCPFLRLSLFYVIVFNRGCCVCRYGRNAGEMEGGGQEPFAIVGEKRRRVKKGHG